jgi:hypothetical protein
MSLVVEPNLEKNKIKKILHINCLAKYLIDKYAIKYGY